MPSKLRASPTREQVLGRIKERADQRRAGVLSGGEVLSADPATLSEAQRNDRAQLLALSRAQTQAQARMLAFSRMIRERVQAAAAETRHGRETVASPRLGGLRALVLAEPAASVRAALRRALPPQTTTQNLNRQ